MEQMAEVDTHGGQQVPLEVLERKLMSHAAHIAAAEAQWLQWLGEYDRRRGWAEWGCSSCAHWLSWKCGMTTNAARERVRVAGALADLPLIRAEFEAGRLSYSKVRAVTRVANEFNEPELVGLALHATGAQLESICRGYRRSQPVDESKPHESRSWSRRIDGDAGVATIVWKVPIADLIEIERHISAEADAVIDDARGGEGADKTRRDVITERGGIAAVRADAAIALMTGAGESTGPEPSDLTMVAPECERERTGSATCSEAMVLAGDRLLGPEVGRRLCCDPRITALVERAEAKPLRVGRATRLIGRRLRRALMRRDAARCQYPGCCATRHLHAHHMVHWSDGGPTELDNLVLLCPFHHHLVHEGGYRVDPATRTFIAPDRGRLDSRCDARRFRGNVEATHMASRSLTGGPPTLAPPNYDRLDRGWTVTMLHHNESVRRRHANGP